MPATVELSEAEQNAVLLRLYALAQSRAEELVGFRYREDLVHDLALAWLLRLRAGTWDVPAEAWDVFVEDEIRNRKAGNRRAHRRAAARDAVHLDIVTNARREWMSPELQLEEERLQEFATQVRRTLPRKCVRAHRLVRDEDLTYAEAAKKLRVSPDLVHDYVKTVHRAFRGALPAIGVEPPNPRRGAQPGRARRRPFRVRRNRRHRGVPRGRDGDKSRAVP